MAGADAWNMFLWTFQDVDVFRKSDIFEKTLFCIMFLTMILDLVL